MRVAADGLPRCDALFLRYATFTTTLDRFVMPPMLLAIARSLDAPVKEVAAAAATYFLAYGLLQPVWGLVRGQVGTVAVLQRTSSAAALATASAALAGNVLVLALAWAAAGAAFGATFPATLIYVGDAAPPGTRQREVTGLMVGVAVGTSVAAAGGGVLAERVSWRAAFAAWAAMHSTLQTWATEVLSPARAAAVSLFAGSLFAGSAVAAAAGGLLADDGRYRTLFAAAAVGAVPLAILAWAARRRWETVHPRSLVSQPEPQR